MVVYHKSCGAIVYTDKNGVREYLLLKYPQGHFDFVKGHVEDHDSDEIETACRELKEETGISEFEVVKGFMVPIHYDFKAEGELHEKTVDFFLIKTDQLDVEISHEHRGFVWLPFDEALKKTTFDQAKDVLIAAEGFLEAL